MHRLSALFPRHPRFTWHYLLGALGLLWLAPSHSHTAEINIASASDLKFALDEIVLEFRTNHPSIAVKVSYGSSGNFYAQLNNRAPFDIFLSADIEYPKRLAAAGLGLDTNVFPYAIGRLAVWTLKESPVDVAKLGMSALPAPAVRKISIANPQHAPYGRAAIEAMKTAGVFEAVQGKLVHGDNVAQAAHYVQSGAADIGIVALAFALAPPMRDTGSYWEVPVNAHAKLNQGGLILRWTKEAPAARTFRDYLLSAPGQSVLKRHGFMLPEK